MLDKIIIVPATLNDISLIKPLIQELIDTMKKKQHYNIEKSVKNLSTLINDSASYVFVARDKNRILGLVNFMLRTTIIHQRPAGLIDELVVAQGHRNLGIGKKLILSAIDKCRELGCCEVEVTTERSNTLARKFYKVCGFEEEEAVLFELHIEE